MCRLSDIQDLEVISKSNQHMIKMIIAGNIIYIKTLDQDQLQEWFKYLQKASQLFSWVYQVEEFYARFEEELTVPLQQKLKQIIESFESNDRPLDTVEVEFKPKSAAKSYWKLMGS